jgi:hypothetical protein
MEELLYKIVAGGLQRRMSAYVGYFIFSFIFW